MRRLLRAAAAAAVGMVACAPAPAQDYPTRSITLIVPYPAGSAARQRMHGLLGTDVPRAVGVLPAALGNLQAGTLRAIAVLGPTRFSLLPDVPTANESGLPGFESVLHDGLLAPASTPRPIIERLNAALRALAESAEVKQRIVAEGRDPL